MQLPPYSKNGAHPPVPPDEPSRPTVQAPRRSGSFLHKTSGGVTVRIETWALPGVGARWYVMVAGRYLSPSGYDVASIDHATGFGHPDAARRGADVWETCSAVEPAPESASVDVPALEIPIEDVVPDRGAAVLDSSLRYRSRGETYEIEGWREVETALLTWVVRKGQGLYLKPPGSRGGSMEWGLGMAGAAEFANPAEAQAAIVLHVERDEAATAAARLREIADRVARGELFVRFQPADSAGDEVATITRSVHQPGARTA